MFAFILIYKGFQNFQNDYYQYSLHDVYCPIMNLEVKNAFDYFA